MLAGLIGEILNEVGKVLGEPVPSPWIWTDVGHSKGDAVWVWISGQLLYDYEDDDRLQFTHGDLVRWAWVDRLGRDWRTKPEPETFWLGRYSEREGIITVSPPENLFGKVTKLPSLLRRELLRAFPDTEEIHLYTGTNVIYASRSANRALALVEKLLGAADVEYVTWYEVNREWGEGKLEAEQGFLYYPPERYWVLLPEGWTHVMLIADMLGFSTAMSTWSEKDEEAILAAEQNSIRGYWVDDKKTLVLWDTPTGPQLRYVISKLGVKPERVVAVE